MPVFIDIKDPAKLAGALAAKAAAVLSTAIGKNGQACLVVSGGSTPKPFFQQLSKIQLDWSKVTITLADERCVEPGSEQSNAKLVKSLLLRNAAAKAKFISLFDGESSPQQARDKLNKKLSPQPAYDLVILGMGNDGHTASIFPEAENRDLALDMENKSSAMLVDPVTVTPLRITQTASRLVDSELIIIHIAGDEKAGLLQQATKAPDEKKWPISFFLTQTHTPVEVFQSSSSGEEQI